MSSLRVVQAGSKVLLLVNGSMVADIPWQAALKVSKALRSVAKLAEEWDNAERLIADQALMIRTGAPFGLTNNRKITEAAYTEAQWGDLRRHVPAAPTIRSREEFGTPRIIAKEPKR